MTGAGCKMDVYHATSANFAEASFACPQKSGTGYNTTIDLIMDAIFLVSIFLVPMLLVLSVPGAAALGLTLLLWAVRIRNVNKALRKEEHL